MNYFHAVNRGWRRASLRSWERRHGYARKLVLANAELRHDRLHWSAGLRLYSNCGYGQVGYDSRGRLRFLPDADYRASSVGTK